MNIASIQGQVYALDQSHQSITSTSSRIEIRPFFIYGDTHWSNLNSARFYGHTYNLLSLGDLFPICPPESGWSWSMWLIRFLSRFEAVECEIPLVTRAGGAVGSYLEDSFMRSACSWRVLFKSFRTWSFLVLFPLLWRSILQSVTLQASSTMTTYKYK